MCNWFCPGLGRGGLGCTPLPKNKWSKLRDLFGDFHDRIKIAKINTRKHNSDT